MVSRSGRRAKQTRSKTTGGTKVPGGTPMNPDPPNSTSLSTSPRKGSMMSRVTALHPRMPAKAPKMANPSGHAGGMMAPSTPMMGSGIPGLFHASKTSNPQMRPMKKYRKC